MSFLTVLPLAFVMIAGPQIISATLLATGPDARRNSLALLAGAALAITARTMQEEGHRDAQVDGKAADRPSPGGHHHRGHPGRRDLTSGSRDPESPGSGP